VEIHNSTPRTLWIFGNIRAHGRWLDCAQAASDPSAGLTFICGLTNAEDLVQAPGMPWIVEAGEAHDNEHVE
jgi:hypothetical protein